MRWMPPHATTTTGVVVGRVTRVAQRRMSVLAAMPCRIGAGTPLRQWRMLRRPASRAGGRELLRALAPGPSLAIFPEGTSSPGCGLPPFRGDAFFAWRRPACPWCRR